MPYGVVGATAQPYSYAANRSPGPGMLIPGGGARHGLSSTRSGSHASSHHGSNSAVTHASSDPDMYVVGHLSLSSVNSSNSSMGPHAGMLTAENLAQIPQQISHRPPPLPRPDSHSPVVGPSHQNVPEHSGSLEVTAYGLKKCPRCNKRVIYKSDQKKHICLGDEGSGEDSGEGTGKNIGTGNGHDNGQGKGKGKGKGRQL